eukprot:Sspe_Gene.32869::Locus_16090_Transcript_1_2_Confidence_0.500_Length_4544::g.32869::m.32869
MRLISDTCRLSCWSASRFFFVTWSNASCTESNRRVADSACSRRRSHSSNFSPSLRSDASFSSLAASVRSCRRYSKWLIFLLMSAISRSRVSSPSWASSRSFLAWFNWSFRPASSSFLASSTSSTLPLASLSDAICLLSSVTGSSGSSGMSVGRLWGIPEAVKSVPMWPSRRRRSSAGNDSSPIRHGLERRIFFSGSYSIWRGTPRIAPLMIRLSRPVSSCRNRIASPSLSVNSMACLPVLFEMCFRHHASVSFFPTPRFCLRASTTALDSPTVIISCSSQAALAAMRSRRMPSSIMIIRSSLHFFPAAGSRGGMDLLRWVNPNSSVPCLIDDCRDGLLLEGGLSPRDSVDSRGSYGALLFPLSLENIPLWLLFCSSSSWVGLDGALLFPLTRWSMTPLPPFPANEVQRLF